MLRCAQRIPRLGRVQCPRFYISRALLSTGTAAPPTPWFIDQEPVPKPVHGTTHSPLFKASTAPPVPQDAPALLKELHAELLQSPHLDLSTLLVTQAVPPPPGPPLPERLGQGKRKRGGTIAGESAYDNPSGIWSWFIFAQVKEGTEGRGAVESVVRQVRKSLLTRSPSVTLPPKSRRQLGTGWALIDGGNFAVHILSKEAREKYFSDIIPQ